MEDSVTLTQAQLDEKLREAAHNATAAALAAAQQQIKKLQAALTEAYCRRPSVLVTLGMTMRPAAALQAERWDKIPGLVHDWGTMGGIWVQSQLRITEHQRGRDASESSVRHGVGAVAESAVLRAPWQQSQ